MGKGSDFLVKDVYGRYYSSGNQGSLECGGYYVDFCVSPYKSAYIR